MPKFPRSKIFQSNRCDRASALSSEGPLKPGTASSSPVSMLAERFAPIEPYASHRQRIVRTLREAVRLCPAHPAVLCYAIGNEIPASVVRWSNHQKVAAFLDEIAEVVRQEDPGSLLTYVNYPTTEYLELDFIDFVAFNVYLESKERLAAYLARLQNLAGDRPLLMAEIGLDSRRNGEHSQSDVLAWQIETAFEGGCIGAFVFAWTDEWYRGGCDIEDWDFGLTRRNRKPKPALD